MTHSLLFIYFFCLKLTKVSIKPGVTKLLCCVVLCRCKVVPYGSAVTIKKTIHWRSISYVNQNSFLSCVIRTPDVSFHTEIQRCGSEPQLNCPPSLHLWLSQIRDAENQPLIPPVKGQYECCLWQKNRWKQNACCFYLLLRGSQVPLIDWLHEIFHQILIGDPR